MHAPSLRASSRFAHPGDGRLWCRIGLTLAPGALASATNCETIPPPGTETYKGAKVVRGSGNIEAH